MTSLREKCPNMEVFFGLYFPVFGLNTEIYSVNLVIQSKYGKIRARKSSIFGQFSYSAWLLWESEIQNLVKPLRLRFLQKQITYENR